MDIQPSIMKYAGILSKVLKVEVEIVDSDLVRVAGTGKFKSVINRNMENEGYVYKSAIETGEPRIIKEPGMDELCLKCPKCNKCEEKYEVCTPIKYGSEVIGVIGLICFNEKQREHFVKDFDTYMEFLQQISDFISATVSERKEKIREGTLLKSLNLVIDKLDLGVIILNYSNRITHINKKAIEILNFIDVNFIQQVNLTEIDENPSGMKEYRLNIGDRNFCIAGNLYPMGLNENQFDRMFIFQDDRNIKQPAPVIAAINKGVRCDDILGESEQIIALKNNVKKIAMSRSTVLITGESGTGKEMFALAVHHEGSRRGKPFIAINCAAIPHELLESELFGYVKGAFTGASSSGKMGKFELADNGSIFLDEIGDMPPSLQIKLLRVLQDRRIVRIGSNKPTDIDVRVIAATNKDLLKLIEEGKFREDLYYRLNVLPLNIPPLRERIKDINALVNYFIEKYTKLLGKNFSSIWVEPIVWEAFYKYSWPGNVRELENTIEFMINMMDTDGRLTIDIIPKNIIGSQSRLSDDDKSVYRLKDLERNEIIKALKLYGDDTRGKKIAAQKLGVGIATLYRKIDEYELSK